MKAQDFESSTPPWIDLEKWEKWIRNNGISVTYGERHNRTDGEVHYILSYKNNLYNMHANYWDWHTGWQKAIDWVESITGR